MKLFIVGPARHGKDTVAEMIRDNFGLSFEPSSMFCLKRCVRPALEAQGFVYSSDEECYADRVNHRIEWRRAIENYNRNKLSRLSQEIFAEHDIYAGIRNRAEFWQSRKFADLAIWVDARDRLPNNDPSLDINEADCDVTIPNNTSLEELDRRVIRLFHLLTFQPLRMAGTYMMHTEEPPETD